MDSDQRLEALKKAYAEVILNTSKEAAAKVMAAKRKAQRLEHEIRGTKEEAVQMMVRLKKKMDDEISEANMASRNQQEKIDELEAQLQEAEDIVTELREELRCEQAKFDRVSRSDMQHLDKYNNATPEKEFEDNRRCRSIPCSPLEFQKDSLGASAKENPYPNHRTEYPKSSSKLIQMRNSYGVMPELPSIILKSKNQKFYRNGYTQRIHACERNISDKYLSLSSQLDDVSGKGKVEGARKDISACKVTLNEVHKMFNFVGKEAVDKNGSISSWYDVQPIKLIPETVKTPSKYRNKSIVGKKIPNKLFMKRHETPSVPHSGPGPKTVENNPQLNNDPTLTTRKLSLDIAGMDTQPDCAEATEINDNDRKGDSEKLMSKGEASVETATKYRKHKISLGEKIPDKLLIKSHETPGVPPSDPSQPNEEPTLMTPKLCSDIEGMDTQPESAKTTETNNNDKGDTEKLISKGESSVNILVPFVREGTSTESSDIQASKSNIKEVDEPILQSKLKITDATSKGSSLQLFKYTFQRKRKRESVSISVGAVSADNHTPERRKETQNTSVEPEKSSLVADSSLESRR